MGLRNKIQLTNQPSESASGHAPSQATLNATLPGGVEWSAWNECRYDWLPGLSSWYVNGASVGNISFQEPKNPAGLILNMWSNSGSWTRNMNIGAASYLQIQWIEIVYNMSGPTTGSKMVRDGLEQALELSTSQVSDQFGPLGELSSYYARPHSHGLVASRGDSSTGCYIVCSIDTTVTSTGALVEVSKAELGKERQVTQLLIVIFVLLEFWFIW